MRLYIDTHMHTIASGHAYNTIDEMTRSASEKGFTHIAITEHTPMMPGSCDEMYFHNLQALRREKMGVFRMFGAELNIMDFQGNVDLPEWICRHLDIVIASFHTPCIRSGTIEQNTHAMLQAIKNPWINIIGHPDDNRYPVDYEAVVKAAHDNNTLLELNNASLKPGGPRTGTWENDRLILELCKRYNTSITVSSDAHVEEDVGSFDYALELLAETDFPESLIAGTDYDKLAFFLNIGKRKTSR